MKIQVTPTGLNQIIREVKNDAKQMQFATALALTRTAYRVRDAERAEMRRVFDRPTPFTLNSLFVKPALKQQASPAAEVLFKDVGASKGTPAGKYLIPQVEGGDRPQKRGERALQIRVNGRTVWVVPAEVIRNKYGNITRGKMTAILSALRANPDTLQNRPLSGPGKRARRSRTSYFALVGRTLQGAASQGAIWERHGAGGRKIRPVLFFVRRPRYRVRFPFYDIARKVVADWFPKELQRAMEQAFRTSR